MVSKPAWIDPVCSSAKDVSRVCVFFLGSRQRSTTRTSGLLAFAFGSFSSFKFFVFHSSVLSTVFLGILVMALKFDGLVEPYTGCEGTEEWDDFWQKFLVLADISGWNSSKRMARLPLFSKADAFKVFSKLPESSKADEYQLPGVMRRSFSVSPGTAFKSFKERKMRFDEMPHVFGADLRRLLELAGRVQLTTTRFCWNSFCMDCPRSSKRSFAFCLHDSR